jgi:hypothetical protein
MHLDSVLQYKALSKGMSEVVLPSAMRVYHVDHSDGWSLESERSGVFEASVKKKLGIQKLTFDELRLLGYAYFVLRGDTNENSPNWGLRDVEARSTLKSGYPSIRCTELIWSKSFDSEHNFFTPHKTKSRINESELGWKSAVNIAIDYLHRTLPRGRPILIWGAGERGVFCLRRLREIGRGDQVVGFLDGDQRKWGHCIDRLRIFGPEKLTDANHAYIKIACHLQSEIEQALRTKGLDAFVDYL